MLDGVEIDTFEDYFFRPRSKYFKPSTLLDHNFHIYSGNHLHSSKYSALVPDEGQFHVIGCKWTPFEITIYRNGKAITAGSSQSPWQQVTFDAINHGTGVTPLHVVLNGNSMFTRPHMRNRSQNGRMPEHFVVDYVRLWNDKFGKKFYALAYPGGQFNELSEKIIHKSGIPVTLTTSTDTRNTILQGIKPSSVNAAPHPAITSFPRPFNAP